MTASFALFRERGYDATSVDMIAKRLGVSKAAIYHHVAGKEAILAVGVDRAMRVLEDVLEENPNCPRDVASPLARFLYVIRRSVEMEIAHLDEVTVLLRLRGNTPLERKLLMRRRAFDRAIIGLVQDAIDAGDIRNDIGALLITRFVFGMVNWLTEWYRPVGPMAPEMLIDGVMRFVTSALAADGPP